MAHRLPPLEAMAKTKRRSSVTPVLERETPEPQFAGNSDVANGDRERIARRAYQLYKERGGRHGRELDDWLEAERELARRGDRGSTPDDTA